MGYMARDVEITYELTSMLPSSDSTYIKYQQFKKNFGEDGAVLFIGLKDDGIFDLDCFNGMYDLTNDIKNIDGVQEVLSLGKFYNLIKNDSTKAFDLRPVVLRKPTSQQELDSIKQVIISLPFYDGILFCRETHATLIAVTLDKDKLNSKKRISVVNEIKTKADKFGTAYNIKLHYSGLPYIRTINVQKVERELKLFILLAMVIASIILFIFFRSFKAVIFPMIIVIISLIWGLGLISVMGYKITILTGIIPPLIIVIGVENCIFLLNKFHHEFRAHRNKVKALSRVVQRVGYASLLTNLATAVGFATFIVTGNKMLMEFGLISAISIMFTYLLSLFLIPIFYSYLGIPKRRHLKHLENKITLGILEKIIYLVQYRRRTIYIATAICLGIGIVGITQLRTTGRLVDDIAHRDPLYTDLVFFENEFHGVLPYEILIDTRKPKGVLRLPTLEKISQLQDTLSGYPEFSKSLSIADVAKFAKQAFYNGNVNFYSLPNSQEKNFILSYLPRFTDNRKNFFNSFVDTSFRVTRVSVQMANLGTYDIQRINENLRPKIESIFPSDKYNVEVTGASIVFFKGSEYLVRHLLSSLLLAIAVIACLMAILFTSYKMVGISLITNLIPQILTAALMGFLGVTIKPSTIVIFSIALGISVDNTIQYLSRYRADLRRNHWNIKSSVISSLRETGFSMIYSSSVLFLGFAIFILSSIGGTQALGYLVSITLFIALLSNLFVLPSMLLTLDWHITTKAFKEPLIEIQDEEEDIELNDLEIKEPDTRGSA
jgi:predicted RND superfamily exporter protein